VVFVEGDVEGAAAMARGSEGYALGGYGRVGVEGVVGGDEAGEIDQVGWEWELAGLVGCLGSSLGSCWIGAHAFWCPRGVVARCHYMGCRLREEVGLKGGTEVAAKDACVLRAHSLKRECSQLSVRLEYCRVGSGTSPATCTVEF
jgi:hypothetical protein